MLKKILKVFMPQKDDQAPKDSEKKIQISELRYRRLFETAQDGILILDANSGKIEDVNPFLKEILGYSESELLGKQLWEIGVFKDIVDSKKAFLELQNKGYIRYKDLPLQTKDGKSVDVEFVSNVYTVGAQRVIQCNIRDVTERKEADHLIEARTTQLENLTRSQEETKKAMLNVMEDLEVAKATIEFEKVKDEAMIASIGEGLVAVDNTGKVTMINKAAESILDRKASKLLGKKITGLPLENEAGIPVPIAERPTTIALSEGRLTSKTYYYMRKDNTKIPIAINATPIKLKGKIIGLIEVIRDIAREVEVDKAKSEFVSLASHQLRTPLGVIKWYIEALENEKYFSKAPPSIRNYLDEIYKSNERVLSLVRDLLSVSRIEQGSVKNAPKSVSVISLLTEITKQMQTIAHEKKVSLHLTIKNRKIPSIKIDILRLREVMENLIINALEYTKPKGSVMVTINRVGPTASINIKDTGIGISLPDQKKLFTKFFRTGKAIIQNPEGSGLGLYVVKSYVEGWGGNISLKSSEGKGSEFTVNLPINQKKDTMKAALN